MSSASRGAGGGAGAGLLAPNEAQALQAALQGSGLCDLGVMPELDGEGVGFDNANSQASFNNLRALNKSVQTTLGSLNPSTFEATRSILLSTAFPEEVRVLARGIVGPMFMCMQDASAQITEEQINIVLDCIIAELMKDVPLTTIVTSLGNLFLSLYYRNNPLRIGVAVGHAAATGYIAWIGGLNKVSGLSVEAAGMLLSGLMAGYGYLVAPGPLSLEQPPRFQGPVPFNVSNFNRYWGHGIELASGDKGIIEEIRTLFGSLVGNPMNQALFLAELSRRLVDKCVPVGPGFQPLARFNPQDPVPAGETPHQRILRELRNGTGGVFNYLLGLIDMVRKLKPQGVAQVGSPDESFRRQLCNQLTLLVAGIYRSFRAQGIRTGLNDDQINEIFLSALLDLMLPSELREAALLGHIVSAQDEMLSLVSKIRSGVIRCWNERRFDERILGHICPYFNSQITEPQIARHVEHDLMHLLDVTRGHVRAAHGDGDGDSMEAIASQTGQDEFLRHIEWDFGKLQQLGILGFVTENEKEQLLILLRDQRFLSWCLISPEIAVRKVKELLMSAAKTAGSTTNTQLKNLLEEAAKSRSIDMPHQFPPGPLVFLKNITAVLRMIQDVMDEDLSLDDTIPKIIKNLEQFGNPEAVLNFVMSIIRMSIVWSLKGNPDLFTLAIKTPKDRRIAPYPVLLLNLDSIEGWKVGDSGRIQRVEIPIKLLERCARDIYDGVSNTAGSLLGTAGNFMAGKACAVGSAVGGWFRKKPELPPQPQSQSLHIMGEDIQPAVPFSSPSPAPPSSEASNAGVLPSLSVDNPGALASNMKACQEVESKMVDDVVMECLDDLISDATKVAAAAEASQMIVDSPPDESPASASAIRTGSDQPSNSKRQKPNGGKSRKTTKRTRRNKGRKSSKTSKKTQQRRSSRHRRSSRKGRE